MPSRRRRGLIWVLTFLLLGIMIIAIWGLQNRRHPDGEPTVAAANATPTVELLGSRLSHYDPRGRLLWTVISESLRYQKEVEQTVGQDVQVQFFTADHPALQLRAARLVFFNRSGDLALSGKVVAQDEQQDLRFQTEGALWIDDKGVLKGEKPLELEREDLMLQGVGFSYWPNEDKLLVQSAQLRFWPNRR